MDTTTCTMKRKTLTALPEKLEVIFDFNEEGRNLARGKHHGIGYLDGKLILFKSQDAKSVTCRDITLMESLQWKERMEIANKKAADKDGGFSSAQGDFSAEIRWLRELRAAIKN